MFSLPRKPGSIDRGNEFFDENWRLMRHLRKLQENTIEKFDENANITKTDNTTEKADNKTVKVVDNNDDGIRPEVPIFENSTTGIRNSSNFNGELFDEFLCAETKIDTFQVKYFAFDMSGQLGFPPETYNFYFEIDNGNRKEIVTLMESNFYGSFSEIPLYTDAKLFLMKNDFKFKVKIQAQSKISIKIKIKYFISAFLNVNYQDSMIFDCRNAVKELFDYEDIEKSFAR